MDVRPQLPTVDEQLLVRIPVESQERLHVGVVTEADGTGIAAEFEGVEVVPATDAAVYLYYNAVGRFMKQPARIDAVDEGPPLVARFETTGDAVGAEEREHVRVSAVASDLTAKVGDDEEDCPLLDVSPGGFSLLSDRTHSVGMVVNASVSIDGRDCTGPAIIRSVTELWKGRYRYGLECAPEADALKQILASVSAALK